MKKEEMYIKDWELVVISNVKSLVGQVLTKIEAAIPGKVQRESLKQLVENDIYDARNTMLEELNNLFKEGSKE